MPNVVETRRLLAALSPYDETEARHRAAMLDLIHAGGDPFTRHRPDPGHFTASAFVVYERSLLLVHHRIIGRWLQPGGHIEPTDASPRAAAQREAEEETGVEGVQSVEPGLFDVDVHQYPARDSQPAHLHFDLRFLFRTTLPDLRPSPEVAGAEWVPFAEVGGDLARPVRKLSLPIL